MDVGADLDTRDIDRLIANLDGADALVRAAAFGIEADAKAAIQGGKKTGREYRRGRKVHRASASGEAPATDTGFLVNSGYSKALRFALWEVGFTAAYARILEEAKNRPFLGPAVERARRGFEQAVRRLMGGR